MVLTMIITICVRWQVRWGRYSSAWRLITRNKLEGWRRTADLTLNDMTHVSRSRMKGALLLYLSQLTERRWHPNYSTNLTLSSQCFNPTERRAISLSVRFPNCKTRDMFSQLSAIVVYLAPTSSSSSSSSSSRFS